MPAYLRTALMLLVSGAAQGAHTGSPLPHVVQWFKIMSANAYIRGVKHNDWPPFPGRFWQRNYYERIIRNDGELNDIRE